MEENRNPDREVSDDIHNFFASEANKHNSLLKQKDEFTVKDYLRETGIAVSEAEIHRRLKIRVRKKEMTVRLGIDPETHHVCSFYKMVK